MPKYEIIHPAGHILKSDIKEYLLRYFGEAELQRLERLGGRIYIAIAAPYTDKRKRGKQKDIIDLIFIKNIEKYKNEPDKMKDILNKLTVKQLKEIARIIGQPLRSNANLSEIHSELMRYFLAEDFWKRISGTNIRKS